MKKFLFAGLAVLSALLLIYILAIHPRVVKPDDVTPPESQTSEPTTPPAENGGTPAPQAPETPVAPETITPAEPETPALVFPYDLLETMTLEQKAAQMFLIRCDNAYILSEAQELQPGGWILFAANTKNETAASLSELIRQASEAAQTPMLIAVDEEGGTVSRIGRYTQYAPSPFLSPQALDKRGGLELIAADAKEKSELLRALGFNLNLAPVCDVSTSRDDFINARSFGKDGEKTAEYAAVTVAAMKQAGIGSCLKHFPGYGNNADTHTGSALDKRPLSTFETVDFLPFEAGIGAGADCVLISHNVVECMDSLPASLSPKAHEILRGELGFEGVIMTDDLVMKAITDITSPEEAAVMAVLAGNDMLIASSYRVQLAAVILAVEDGRIDERVIDEAAARVLLLKRSLGLL